MSRDRWQALSEAKRQRTAERLKLEAHFNAEITRRHQAGDTREQIISDLGISATLFNRVTRGLGRQE